MRDLLVGAVVPHAPLLVEGVAGPKVEPKLAGIRAALGALDLGASETVVIVSPHGREAGVWASVAGDLRSFGPAAGEVEAKTDPIAVDELAARLRWPVLDGPPDHGVLVPLATLDLPDVPVVAVSLRETTGPEAANVECGIDDGRRVAGALRSLARDRDLAVVASAHGSAALDPRAPLTHLEEGDALEASVGRALDGDVAALDEIPATLYDGGGACGAGPLTMFGRLFRGRALEVLAHEAPFGVGYIVAVTR